MFWFEHCFLCDGGYGDICDYNDDDHAYDHDCDDDAGMLMIINPCGFSLLFTNTSVIVALKWLAEVRMVGEL